MKKLSIGRAPDNDIRIDHPGVSNRHADLEIDDAGAITFTDHSTNGTLVAGVKVHGDSCRLHRGDEVLFPGRLALDWSRIPRDERATRLCDLGATRPLRDRAHAGGAPEAAKISVPSATMSFGDAVASAFNRYTDFSGRSRRSEYWWFVLLSSIVMLIPFVNLVWVLATCVPSLALAVRRMHDIGRSGTALLIVLLPLVGWIVIVVWLMQDSDPGTNAYGTNPKM